MGVEFRIFKMRRVLEVDRGGGCTPVCKNLIPLNCALENG